MGIRPATLKDAANLCKAEQQTAKTPGLLNSRPEELSLAVFEESIRIHGATGSYLVSIEEDEIVGHALLQPLSLAQRAHV